jgi:hypothetical protein
MLSICEWRHQRSMGGARRVFCEPVGRKPGRVRGPCRCSVVVGAALRVVRAGRGGLWTFELE